MKRLATAALALALALTGCSAEEPVVTPETSDTTAAATSSAAAGSEASAAEEPEAEPGDEAGEGVSPDATAGAATGSLEAREATETVPAELIPNEFTEVCADTMQQIAPLAEEALEQADDPAAASSLYGRMADIFADGVERVDGQDVKAAFTAMADSFRDVADNLGEASTEQLGDANEQFIAACFGG
ncbi:hypothetical protein E8P82_11365 [Arthrobacter echini]|uniref:Uncharacterized protein n=1 Tax=Arthrobacter echini TaxID=1529066 RepID=A0A4S5E379_9MICC|nr:hypothetical protein [Arthrobacter echini]THJ65868.1 hypothetical protein E8P82_11365 [Arthrobacter echini]